MRTKLRQFWSDNLTIGAATAISGVLNYLYAVLLAHRLGPAQYGVVATLNNVVSVLALPAAFFGLAALRRGRLSRSRLAWAATAVGAGVWLGAGLAGGWWRRKLHVSPALVQWFGLGPLWTLSSAVFVGYLERARRYRLVAGLAVAGAGLSVGAVLWATAPGRAHRLLWLGIGQSVVSLGVWAWAAWASRKAVPMVAEAVDPRQFWAVLTASALLSVWSVADSLWAKMALSSVNAGLYVGLATIGQALPFVTAGVATVMLTAVLDHPSGRSQYLRLTRQVVLGLSVIFLALMVCVPGVLVRWSLGEAYRAVVPLLAPYGIAMVCEAWAMVELTRSVADNELGSLLLGGLGTLAWIGGLSQAHTLAAGVEQTVLWMAATVLGLAVGRMWAQP